MTYECTVFVGNEATTFWKGDFFHCSTGLEPYIELVHRQRDDFSPHTCNNGNVVAKVSYVLKMTGSYLYSTLHNENTSFGCGHKILLQ